MLARQESVVSRSGVTACGMSPEQIRHRIRPGGPWQRLLPGVYLAVTGTPTRRQLEIAALLYAGPGSAITGVTALRRHGVQAPDSGVITVLIPRGRARADRPSARADRPSAPADRPSAQIWPTTRIPRSVCVDGPIVFTHVARAVADAARELSSFRDYRAVLADAVQQRYCKPDTLARELAGVPVRYSGWLRAALAEVADGVRSVAEGDLRTLILRAGLPIPMFNARLYEGRQLIAVADAWWPEAGVAAEVDSRAWHLSPDDWDRTQRRSARMTSLGILVVPFSPQRIRTEPQEVADEIRKALNQGRGRPALPIRALPAA
jgi:hypothetical protein